jgi:hypothetical protein
MNAPRDGVILMFDHFYYLFFSFVNSSLKLSPKLKKAFIDGLFNCEPSI